jgi:hypothetical protein
MTALEHLISSKTKEKATLSIKGKKNVSAHSDRQDKKGFTSALLRLRPANPPAKATPPGKGLHARVICLSDRIHPEIIRKSLSAISHNLG